MYEGCYVMRVSECGGIRVLVCGVMRVLGGCNEGVMCVRGVM